MQEIPNYPGYSVSKDGRRVSGPRTKEIRFYSDRRGYLHFWVYRGIGGGRQMMYVHRAVAITYVGGDRSLTVNHIDGNKKNNSADNLEWISNADNLRHSFKSGFRVNLGHKKGTVSAFSKSLRESMFMAIRCGASIRSVAIANGVGIKTLQYQYLKNGALV